MINYLHFNLSCCDTGNSTGDAAKPQDLKDLIGKLQVPLLIGSGVTKDNLIDYFPYIQAAIIGSHFKHNGNWANELCETSIESFIYKVQELRK